MPPAADWGQKRGAEIGTSLPRGTVRASVAAAAPTYLDMLPKESMSCSRREEASPSTRRRDPPVGHGDVCELRNVTSAAVSQLDSVMSPSPV